MQEVILEKHDHSHKIADICPFYKANVTTSSIFILDGKILGFYLKELPEKVRQLLTIADTEFRSDRVDKDLMRRGTKEQAAARGQDGPVQQFSAMLGGTPSKEHFKRFYKGISKATHDKKSQLFAQSMYALALECEDILKEHMPEQYEYQSNWIRDNVAEPYRIGSMFTSSISNFNIAAPFHQDKANLKRSTNIILTRRQDSLGGCLTVPEYGATIEQADLSMLVYPAVSNIHAVTPIVARKKGGYRNSFVFYALKNMKS